jgi:hypothetical protein
MPTNFYFQSGNTSGTTNEQRLVEDLVIESLKIYGHDVYYLPRQSGNLDGILGEDALQYFDQAYPLEMYLENVQGFEGEGELFSKFGFEFRSSATFVVAKRRWEEGVGQNVSGLQLPDRPAEGDLLYFSKTKTFFAIKYVDFLNPFYQLGKIYTYKLQCDVFEFSSESIDTGIDEIDSITDASSQDLYRFQLLMESGDYVLNTSADSIILDIYATEDTDPQADNDEFEVEAQSILDFTAFNPFGEVQKRA